MHVFADFDAGWILPLIIWPWLLVSLFVYARRAWRKRQPGADASATDPVAGTTNAATPSASAVVPTAPLGAPSSDAVGGTSGSLVEAVIREELEARKRAEAGEAGEAGTGPTGEAIAVPAAPGRAGLFAPASKPNDEERPRVPVAEALAGIALPCDLAPLVTDDTDDHHAVFLTKGVAPGTVGAAVGDELERLGYTLTSVDDTTVRATRDGATLTVVLHPDGSQVRRDDQPVFPTATRASVVVEFST